MMIQRRLGLAVENASSSLRACPQTEGIKGSTFWLQNSIKLKRKLIVMPNFVIERRRRKKKANLAEASDIGILGTSNCCFKSVFCSNSLFNFASEIFWFLGACCISK